MKELLVTGLTGRSGQYFGALLHENKIKNVTAVVRSTQKFDALFGNCEMNCVQGDLHDTAFLQQVMQKNNIDTVFHIAGIGFSRSVVQAAAQAGCVRTLFLVHTTGIYSKYKEAAAGYLQTEEEIGILARNAGMELIILRPTMIYGTLDDGNISVFVRMVDKLPVFPLVGGGRFALQPVHHKDLGTAYYQILMHRESLQSNDYVLSGGTVIDLKDLLQLCADLLEKRRLFFFFPYPIALTGAKVLYLLSAKRIDLREKVQRLVEPRAYDHTQASRDFGYDPMPFAQGLQEEIRMYRSQNN